MHVTPSLLAAAFVAALAAPRVMAQAPSPHPPPSADTTRRGYTAADVRQELERAEKSHGPARRDALTPLATSLGQDATTSSDRAKVQKLIEVVTQLANGTGAAAGGS
jgi:hypothetical protein